ncbi:MAG: pilus assembly protein PilP [Granulosicoccaceae bacterium]
MKSIATIGRHSSAVAAFSLIALSSVLTGCGQQDMADLEQYVNDRRQAHAGYVEPLPEYELYKGFTYASKDLRDPFGIPDAAAASPMTLGSNKNKPDLNRRREVLEMFPLDSLQMVGELARNGSSWGLVKDSDGVVHRVKAGNYAGQNFGRILAVSESNIDIEETIQDGLGNWITREAQLTLGE